MPWKQARERGIILLERGSVGLYLIDRENQMIPLCVVGMKCREERGFAYKDTVIVAVDCGSRSSPHSMMNIRKRFVYG